MKFLIITLLGRKYNNNHGAVLQGLALQAFLRKHGYDSQILDYYPFRQRPPFLTRVVKALKKGYLRQSIYVRLLRLLSKGQVSILNREQKMAFTEFRNEYINFSEETYCSFEKIFNDLQNFQKTYDLFIVGSDQVWNSAFHDTDLLKVYLLGFVKQGSKISYASSVASEIPNGLIGFYRKYLSRFFRISVREEGSARELSKVLGYKPAVVLDPTLLLAPGDWVNYSKRPAENIEEQFIFVYDLYRSKEIIPVVEKVANRYRIKYANYDPHVLLKKHKHRNLLLNFYKYGPGEFLWLVQNSKFVITSSFHGTVFAIIFRKPFYVVLWHDKKKAKQNDRIIDILSKLGLQDRAFTDPEEILERGLDENIDWEQVYEKLEKLKQESAEWLLNAISEALKEKGNPRRHENVSAVQDCYGCFACYNICPQNAIEMVLDKEGFYSQRVNANLCTKCGLCVDVCPALNFPKNENLEKPKAYAAWSLDEPTRLASASGGIYPELAKATIEKGGVVIAVGWDKDWLPVHEEIEAIDDIRKTVSSKYVQSNVGRSYERVVNYAKEGRNVLFVGTPCQIAGLKNILSKKLSLEAMKKVTLVDLVCHGVNSSLVFKKYLDENFDRERITEINFRSKDTGWSKFSFKVVPNRGTTMLKHHIKDGFFYGFLTNLYLCSTCYECPFNTLPRQGDITLGDFWGVPEKYKDERGVSVVLVNNDKGKQVLQELVKGKRIFAEEVPFETATKSNPRIYSGYMEMPEEREKILKEYRNKSWKYIERKYIKPPKGLRGVVRKGLSFAKRVVRRLLKR